jgi:hypothetical protein
LPWRSQTEQQVAVDTVPTGGFPRQHQQGCEGEENRVDADGTGEHVARVHRRAEEGRDPGEDPEDQSESDEDLAERNQVAEERGVREDDVREKRSVPALNVGVRTLRLGQCTGKPGGEERTGVGSGPTGGLCFFDPFGEPLPADIDTNDEPDPGVARFGKEGAGQRRIGDCDVLVIHGGSSNLSVRRSAVAGLAVACPSKRDGVKA